jgi:hypothetical protein
MDFVVGIEIKLSNNHTLLGADGKPHAYYDMCDRLAGRYPKDFKFTGWHPHCRCHAEPILKTQEEMDADTERILDGEEPTPSEESENAVSDVPQAFKDHLEKYADTIRTVDNSRLPYYVQDNRERVDEVLGLAVDKGSISATPNPQKAAEYLAIEQALGITQGAPMSFEEANELRGNPHFAEAESYRINCQTCVVANELRRRGFPVEALPNTKGSALEKLSYATQNAWLDADGNIPKKIQCYTLNMDRRGRIVTKEANKWKLLDEATKEPGRYHVDWRWKRSRSGHIVTLERLDDGRIRWYDPQSGTINCMTRYWETKVTEIRVLRVDTLKPNPEVCKNVLAKSGSKSVMGKAAGGGSTMGAKKESNGIVSLIKQYYTVDTNKEKVDILQQIIQDKSFKKLRYHSTKNYSIFGVNMKTFDRILNESEMPKNLTIAKKLTANKMDVYFLPNPSDTLSADYIVRRNGKLFCIEGKTLNGNNSLDHLLSKGAKQAERICVDIVGTDDTKYIAKEVKAAFLSNTSLREVWLFKGGRLLCVSRQIAGAKTFDIDFKRLWEQSK